MRKKKNGYYLKKGIIDILGEHNITQVAFASIAEISYGYLSSALHGAVSVGAKKRIGILNALSTLTHKGVSFGDVFTASKKGA